MNGRLCLLLCRLLHWTAYIFFLTIHKLVFKTKSGAVEGRNRADLALTCVIFIALFTNAPFENFVLQVVGTPGLWNVLPSLLMMMFRDLWIPEGGLRIKASWMTDWQNTLLSTFTFTSPLHSSPWYQLTSVGSQLVGHVSSDFGVFSPPFLQYSFVYLIWLC